MELATSIGLSRTSRSLSAEPPSVPTALGMLPDLTLERNTPITPTDLARDFFGAGMIYELAPGSAALPAGLGLSSSGLLSGTPMVNTEPVSIVVRATNAQGSADSGFSVTVVEMILDFTPTLTGLTSNPTHGLTAETGVPLSAGATAYTGNVPGSISYQWATLQSGPIIGATAASYTPNADLFDQETLYCTVSPVGYPAKDTQSFVIRHVPPVAAGALWDEIVDLGSGPELFDVSGDFTGEALAFSVTGPGASITSSDGLLTLQTDSPVAGAIITVTALNSGGQVQSAFTLTVEDGSIGPGPDLGQPVLDDATDTISLTVDMDCTIYWRRDATGTNPTAAAVIAGGGFDSGSFAVIAGENTANVTFAEGNDGLQEITFVAAVIPGEPSLAQTVAIDIDATDPVLAGAVPSAGATNVAANVTPTLTFSEAVVPGSGTVSIFNVTAGAVSESFDVAVDAGIAAGQVEITGNTLTIRPTAPLSNDTNYAVLIDPGALRDIAGNPFQGITSNTALGFSVGAAMVVETDFDAGFATAEAELWSSIQTNAFNATAEHRSNEAWATYPASVSDGGIVAVKSGNFPQLRFVVPVEIGKTYTVDADLPVGEGTWSGPLRFKLGSAINLSDYAQIDEPQAGQPSVVEIRGQTVVATTTTLWLAVIVETNGGGGSGGNPAISMLRVREI